MSYANPGLVVAGPDWLCYGPVYPAMHKRKSLP
jgi:hypothetical protein